VTGATDQVRIDYDDQLNDVVDKINRVLRSRGLIFVDDELLHDGYCVYTLQPIKPVETPR
jgi:hypothetical protein